MNEVYMYQIFNNKGNLLGEFTPGGPGCNNLFGNVITKTNRPEVIKYGNLKAKLNPNWKD